MHINTSKFVPSSLLLCQKKPVALSAVRNLEERRPKKNTNLWYLEPKLYRKKPGDFVAKSPIVVGENPRLPGTTSSIHFLKGLIDVLRILKHLAFRISTPVMG